jgi:hypothetical protein
MPIQSCGSDNFGFGGSGVSLRKRKWRLEKKARSSDRTELLAVLEAEAEEKTQQEIIMFRPVIHLSEEEVAGDHASLPVRAGATGASSTAITRWGRRCIGRRRGVGSGGV